MSQPSQRSTPDRKPAAQLEVVDPRWLLRALAVMLAFGVVCAYLTVGMLFYISSWQLALRPTHSAGGGTGLPSQIVRFGADAAGVPQMVGEWLPAAADSTRSTYAVLYLRGADGQLDKGDGTQIAALHDRGVGVFAFDYRGYGRSAVSPHATQARMQQDAGSAWNYLTGVRKIAPDHVIVFGSGVGVSLAATLLQQHMNAKALIGYNADPEVLERVRRDARTRLFPLRLVFHERFDLDALRSLHQPKLLYTVGAPDAARSEVYRTAADPKLTVEVATHNAQQEQAALARFLDDVASAPTLMPLL